MDARGWWCLERTGHLPKVGVAGGRGPRGRLLLGAAVSAERVRRVLPDGHDDLLIYHSGLIEIIGLYDEVALPVFARGASACAASGSGLLRPQPPSGPRVLRAQPFSSGRHCPRLPQARRLADRETIDAWVRSIEPSP
jgi:hypothetical protein